MKRRQNMKLNGAERAWLPWLGKTGKLAMGWSYLLNCRDYPTVERTFEGIAATRVDILKLWTETQWKRLAKMATLLAPELHDEANLALLHRSQSAAKDFSELFLIDAQGKVLLSTWEAHAGKQDLAPKAVQAGLKECFLHGPYNDTLTEAIGPSTSKFHDEVTLMFYQPVTRDGKTVGCVCGRVPNDVIGDLIQREAGHVFRESGDNYLFMVESHFDPSITPGTALSRSRFEDNAFSYGDNLKQGVPTKWGTVQVIKHTEFELRFTETIVKKH